MRKQRARGGYEMGAIDGGQLHLVAAAGFVTAHDHRRCAARVVMRTRARVGANAIGHVAHQLRGADVTQ